MYKTFTEWKNGNWLEDGEPRKEAYTKDELLLVEMGWKYGFDAGKAQQADRIAELEKAIKDADEWLESGEGVSLCYYACSDSNPNSIKIIKEITG